jgi:lactaldehyde dehydrogenase / glycolaldehyde dehydrogenase
MKICQMYIDGEFISNENRQMIDIINPATETVCAQIPYCTEEDVDKAVKAAYSVQDAWSKLPGIERQHFLEEIVQLMRDHYDEFVDQLIEEQGKTVPGAQGEVSYSIDYFKYFAEFGRRIDGEIIQSDRPNERILLSKEPIGVAAGILPWNFPVLSIARKVAPALIAGNTVVVKPSTDTPLTCYLFAKLVDQSSLPKGVFNMVLGRGARVGNALAGHPLVGITSVTGGVSSGIAIMKAAADNVSKVSLELGGKAPAIVMDDADIDLAVKCIRDGRIINRGQACSCVERVYVHEKIADEFIAKITAAMKAVKNGDPRQAPYPEMGPMVSRNQMEEVDQAVQTAIKQGATLVCGGHVDKSMPKGYYYEPTVLINCKQDSDIMQKEIFGPVLPIATFKDFDDAIENANDCEFGLTSFVFTQNMNIAMRACKEIKFGEMYINRENFEAIQGFHAGWRKSGLGGDDGIHGLDEFLQTHITYIDYNVNQK